MKINCLRKGLVAQLLLASVSISCAVTLDEVAAQYRASDNAISRRAILDGLTSMNNEGVMAFGATATARTVPSATVTVPSLLTEALNDKDPIVVETAIRQIGNLKQTTLAPLLTALYKTADSRFGGYSERIRGAIIYSLADLGGVESRTLLIDLLNKDGGSLPLTTVLAAVRESQDIAVKPALEALISRLTTKIQNVQANGKQSISLTECKYQRDLAVSIVGGLK